MQRLYPSFAIKSYGEAVAFYVDWLGFAIDWAWPDDAPIAYFQVSRGDLCLQLAVMPDGVFAGNAVAHVDDIEAWFEELKAKRPDWDGRLDKTPWGVLRFDATDPFGNHIAVQQEAS